MPKHLNNSKIFSAFSSQLREAGVSKSTFKNYRSDLKLFTDWVFGVLLKKGVSPVSLDEALPFFSPELAGQFKEYLKEHSPSDKTVNRKVSSLRRLSLFLVESQIL